MINEVNYLINELDISTKHAEEIINIYFDEYAGNNWDYMDYLRDEIRIIRDTKENQSLIYELETIDGSSLFKGDDYVMLTNYQTLKNMDEIGEFLPNHSF